MAGQTRKPLQLGGGHTLAVEGADVVLRFMGAEVARDSLASWADVLAGGPGRSEQGEAG